MLERLLFDQGIEQTMDFLKSSSSIKVKMVKEVFLLLLYFFL